MLLHLKQSGLIKYWQMAVPERNFARYAVNVLETFQIFSIEKLNLIPQRKKLKTMVSRKPLTLEHLWGSFFVLGIGSMVALFVLLFEIIWKSYSQRLNSEILSSLYE